MQRILPVVRVCGLSLFRHDKAVGRRLHWFYEAIPRFASRTKESSDVRDPALHRGQPGHLQSLALDPAWPGDQPPGFVD